MLYRASIAAAALAVAAFASTEARAFDDSKYPNLKGMWRVVGGPMRFDPTKPWGPGQEAPLVREYQAIFEVNLKDQAEG